MKPELIKLELFIAKLLRHGVLFAGTLILIGWIFQISFTQDTFAQFSQYQGITLMDQLNMLWHTHSWPQLIANAGLFVLISLPVLRVIATGFIFAKQKNYHLVGLVLVVLSGLILSIVLGFEI